MNDNSLICFKAISNFTTELGELFGKKPKKHRKPVRLGSSPNSPFWIIKRIF